MIVSAVISRLIVLIYNMMADSFHVGQTDNMKAVISLIQVLTGIGGLIHES